MKRLLVLLFALLMCVGMVACGDSSDYEANNTLIHASTNDVISLGMQKADVEKMLGRAVQAVMSEYTDGLSIHYSDDVVSSMYVYGSTKWETSHGLKIGSTSDEVLAAFSAAEITESEDNPLFSLTIICRFTKAGKQTSVVEDTSYMFVMMCDESKQVKSILISNA